MDTYEHLVGHRFPGATVALPESVARSWAECVLGAPVSGAHPSAAYLLGLQGTGLRVEEILELFGSSPGEGPLLAGCAFTFSRPLEAARSYAASAGVVAVERKRGRRAATFDLISFEVSLGDDDGECVRCSFTWAIPRRGG